VRGLLCGRIRGLREGDKHIKKEAATTPFRAAQRSKVRGKTWRTLSFDRCGEGPRKKKGEAGPGGGLSAHESKQRTGWGKGQQARKMVRQRLKEMELLQSEKSQEARNGKDPSTKNRSSPLGLCWDKRESGFLRGPRRALDANRRDQGSKRGGIPKERPRVQRQRASKPPKGEEVKRVPHRGSGGAGI